MTAPTDHLAAAREALVDARGTGPAAALHLARAQVHATLAIAEAAQTANLIRALDYGALGHLDARLDERRDEITARLWATT